jgi:hypothetical protein
MRTEIIDITPALAESWLTKNKFNRRISTATVNKYAADMKSGRWNLTHQGIAFAYSGELVDGQHRLKAIIKSCTPVRMMVTWGAEIVGIDELRPRRHIEVIKFGGLSDWLDTQSVQTARAMIEIDCMMRRRGSHTLVSTSQLVDFADKNKQAILFVEGAFRSNTRGIAAALVRGLFGVAWYSLPSSTLARFIEILYSGESDGPHEYAAIRLRDYLMLYGIKTNGGQQARADFTRMAMQCVYNFSRGVPTKRLTGAKDFIFRLPDENSCA